MPPLPVLRPDLLPAAARVALERIYRNAVERSTDGDTVGALGRMLQAWEEWNAAHEAYQRAQALSPRMFDWPYLDGTVLQRLGRHSDAAIRFRHAVELSPNNLPARVKLAQSVLDAGDTEESRRLFEGLVNLRAAEPFAQFGLGRIHAAAGDHEAAIVRFEHAIALFPEWGAAHYAVALSYRALARVNDAQHALELYAQYGPRSPGLDDPLVAGVVALRDDAVANLAAGLKAAEAGDLNGAIAAHEAAVLRNPSFAQAHANLISLYGRARNWEKADEHYRVVLTLGVNLADAHYDYAVVLGLQNKWDLAEETFRRAIVVNPRHAFAHNNLGQILERQGQLEAALDEYRRAVDSQPTFRLARFNVGRMMLALAHPQDAIAELQKLVQPADAEAPRYLYALATAYGRLADRQNAVKWATEARRLALQYGQNDLAAAIERDLAAIK